MLTAEDARTNPKKERMSSVIGGVCYRCSGKFCEDIQKHLKTEHKGKKKIRYICLWCNNGSTLGNPTDWRNHILKFHTEVDGEVAKYAAAFELDVWGRMKLVHVEDKADPVAKLVRQYHQAWWKSYPDGYTPLSKDIQDWAPKVKGPVETVSLPCKPNKFAPKDTSECGSSDDDWIPPDQKKVVLKSTKKNNNSSKRHYKSHPRSHRKSSSYSSSSEQKGKSKRQKFEHDNLSKNPTPSMEEENSQEPAETTVSSCSELVAAAGHDEQDPGETEKQSEEMTVIDVHSETEGETEKYNNNLYGCHFLFCTGIYPKFFLRLCSFDQLLFGQMSGLGSPVFHLTNYFLARLYSRQAPQALIRHILY